jgi:hypothetical protein
MTTQWEAGSEEPEKRSPISPRKESFYPSRQKPFTSNKTHRDVERTDLRINDDQ